MANNSMNVSQVPGFGVPAPHVYIVATLYTLISFAAIIGNGLVLASFFKSSKIRNSRTNYLVVSLSCADIVAGSVAVPLYMYFMLNDFKEYNGSTGYFTYQFTDVFSITASVWHLAVISLERFFAIVFPVVHHIATPAIYFIAMALLWTVSLISGGLSLELYKYKIKYLIGNGAFNFGLPLLIIVSCYMWILKTTVKRSYVTSRPTFKRELKVSLTIFILIALFLMCWCPFFVVGILSASSYAKECNNCITTTMVVYFKALHFATSCVNPIVYAARIPDFRTAFTKILPKQVISFVFCLLQKAHRESPPNSRGRTSSTLSSTVQTSDGGKRRATLLENRAAIDQLPVIMKAKDSPMASSVTSNKCVTFLSDSPSSVAGTHLTKV